MKHISREKNSEIGNLAYKISKREVGRRNQTMARAAAFIEQVNLCAVEEATPPSRYLIYYKVEVNLGTKTFPEIYTEADCVVVEPDTIVHETKKFVIVEYTQLGVHYRKSIRKDNIITYVW